MVMSLKFYAPNSVDSVFSLWDLACGLENFSCFFVEDMLG